MIERESNAEKEKSFVCHRLDRLILVLGVALLALGLLLPGAQDTALANAGPHGNYSPLTDACATCHRTHTNQSPRLIYSVTVGNAFCYSCHDGTGASVPPFVSTHSNSDFTSAQEGNFALECVQCHEPHGHPSNLYSLRDDVRVTTSPLITTGPVVFTSLTGTDSFDENDASDTDDLCATCHINASNPGFPMNSHVGGDHTAAGGSDERGNDCSLCHPHDADDNIITNDGFMPVGGCTACHKQPQGARRQIVDSNGDGTGTGGDFKRTSHHVNAIIPTDADCVVCHNQSQHMGGTVRLINADNPATVYALDGINDPADFESFCLSCHDANGKAGAAPFSDSVMPKAIAGTGWSSSIHNTIVTTFNGSCLDCHDNGHGSNKIKLLFPWNYTGDGSPTDPMRQEERFCYLCHGTGGPGNVVQPAFTFYTNSSPSFYKHAVSSTANVHDSAENTGAAFGGANRHVECLDCHNPHSANNAATAAPAISGEMSGASGAAPGYGGSGPPVSYTWLDRANNQYEACLKCHSSFTALPSYNSTGLRKLYSSDPNQVPDSRNMAQEFNPANASYHPVLAQGQNQNMPPASLIGGWTQTSVMRCSNCHTNPNGATEGAGPHGSPRLHILDGTADYTTSFNSLPTSGEVCFKCHSYDAYVNNSNCVNGSGVKLTNFCKNGNWNLHEHHGNNLGDANCYMCHDTHGSEQIHLINFGLFYNNSNNHLTVSTPYNSQTAYGLNSAGNYGCQLACHGTTHDGFTAPNGDFQYRP